MIIPANNSFAISTSPHSLGLNNSLTVPSWGDDNYFVQSQKAWNSKGFQGVVGGGGFGTPRYMGGLGGLGDCGCSRANGCGCRANNSLGNLGPFSSDAIAMLMLLVVGGALAYMIWNTSYNTGKGTFK